MTVPDLLIGSLDRLNSHARTPAGLFSTERRAIYAYKDFATVFLAQRGEVKAPVAKATEMKGGPLPTTRCDRCDNGVDDQWDFCPFCGEPNLGRARPRQRGPAGVHRGRTTMNLILGLSPAPSLIAPLPSQWNRRRGQKSLDLAQRLVNVIHFRFQANEAVAL